MPPFFLETLQRYCKLVVLSTLGMHGHSHQNDGIYFNETLMLICMQKKNICHLFLAKILQACYFGYFKHAWPPTPKEQFLLVGNFDVYLHFILEILHFKESSIWLAKSISIQNLRKRLLSDKGFAVKYTWLYVLF